MKNNALKAFLLIFILLIISLAYNQIKKSNIVENNQDIVTKDTLIVMSIEQKNIKESFGTTTIENNKTKYSDGRFTAVRNLRYYNDLIKTSIPMKDSRLGLTTIMTEWNEYDGNVASPQGGFIEKPMFLNEVEKKEMREAGIDQSDTFSTMVGGDEETNRRFVEPSKRYWVVASKMFEQEFANLIKAEDISDRTVDYVTFDFITTD